MQFRDFRTFAPARPTDVDDGPHTRRCPAVVAVCSISLRPGAVWVRADSRPARCSESGPIAGFGWRVALCPRRPCLCALARVMVPDQLCETERPTRWLRPAVWRRVVGGEPGRCGAVSRMLTTLRHAPAVGHAANLAGFASARMMRCSPSRRSRRTGGSVERCAEGRPAPLYVTTSPHRRDLPRGASKPRRHQPGLVGRGAATRDRIRVARLRNDAPG